MATGAQTVTSGGGSCQTWISQTSTNDYWKPSVSDCSQKIKISSSTEICEVQFYVEGSSGATIEAEFWTDKDLGGTQKGSDSSQDTIPDGSAQWTEVLTFGTNPDYDSNLYLHIVVDSGSCGKWLCDNTDPYENGNSYDAWTRSSERSGDRFCFKISTIQ